MQTGWSKAWQQFILITLYLVAMDCSTISDNDKISNIQVTVPIILSKEFNDESKAPFRLRIVSAGILTFLLLPI